MRGLKPPSACGRAVRAPFLLVPLLLLAGCVSQGASVDPASAPGAELAGGGEDASSPVTTSVRVSLLLARPVGENDASQSGEFVVPEGATAVVIEAKWGCTSPVCGFALQLLKDGEVVGSAQGNADAQFQLDDPAPGPSIVKLRSSGPAFNMRGEVRATAFFGPVPEGFTAFT